MPRKDYPLTEETRAVVNGSFKVIAEEMSVAPQYVYGIVYEDNPDPFSYFLAFYSAAVRAGVDYHIYDNKLAEVRSRYRSLSLREMTYMEAVIHKLETDAETSAEVLKAVEDGKIDDDERKRLRASIEKIRGNADRLEAMIDTPVMPFVLPDEIKERAKARRNGR